MEFETISQARKNAFDTWNFIKMQCYPEIRLLYSKNKFCFRFLLSRWSHFSLLRIARRSPLTSSFCPRNSNCRRSSCWVFTSVHGVSFSRLHEETILWRNSYPKQMGSDSGSLRARILLSFQVRIQDVVYIKASLYVSLTTYYLLQSRVV